MPTATHDERVLLTLGLYQTQAPIRQVVVKPAQAEMTTYDQCKSSDRAK